MILLQNKEDAVNETSEDESDGAGDIESDDSEDNLNEVNESDASEEEASPKKAEKRTAAVCKATTKTTEPKKKKLKKSKHENSDDDGKNIQDTEKPTVKAKAKKRNIESKSENPAEPEKKKSKKNTHKSSDNEGASNEATEEENQKEPCCILISNLDEDIKEKKIIKHFSAAGVEFDGGLRRNVKKKTCFVDLKDESTLESAVNLSGTKIKGHTITVEHVPPKPSLQSAMSKKKLKQAKKVQQQSDEERSRILFVGNVGFDITADELKNHFPGVIDVRLPLNRNNEKPMGFAFVEFATSEQAQSVLDVDSYSQLNGRQLRLDLDSNRSGKTEKKKKTRFEYEKDNAKSGVAGKTKTLYVKNIAFTTTEETLRLEFPDCLQARLATNSKDGKPRGFAFLDFETADTAQAAFEKKKDATIDGRKIKLDFASELKNPPAKFGGGTGGSGKAAKGKGQKGGLTCYNCGETGHLSRACSKPRSGGRGGHKGHQRGGGRGHSRGRGKAGRGGQNR